MMEPANELRFLVRRVEKLERQNRFYKKVGLGLLLGVASISLMGSLMGQAKPDRTVEADEFIVRDAQGRARVTLTGDELRFADEKGTLALAGNYLILRDNKGNETDILSNGTRINDSQKSTQLSSDGLCINDNRGFCIPDSLGGTHTEHTELTSDGLRVNDSQGFMTQLGRADLVTTRTGVAHKTSAASIVLIGKDGKVLWSAP